MKKRKLPFGYCIRNGKICVDERDSDTVRTIFQHYVQVSSYQKVADMLKRQGTPYIPEKSWNKHIVARILKDGHYIGDEGYPPIIAQDEFHRAAAANTWSCDSPERTRLIKNLRALVRCPACGGVMARNYRANWQCPDCMDNSVNVTDEALESSVSELLNQLIKEAPYMEIPDISPSTTALRSQEHELEQAMDQTEFDEKAAKDQAMALASARFGLLGSEDYETMRIKYILSNAEQNGEFDPELLFHITAAILIYSSGAVSLKLKNGQMIGRSENK